MTSIIKKIVVCSIVTVALGVELVSASTGLSIQPVKVSHTLTPGDEVSGIISLKNESGERIAVDVSVEDFTPSAGTTNISFVGRADGNTTVRDWVTLDVPSNFFFESGESKQIKYTIKAPQDAEPGSHFGVSFFKAYKPEDQSQLKVSTRIGMLMFVTIPGNQLQSGRVLDFKSPLFLQRGPVPFTIKYENTGTVHFEPKGKIEIKNILGKKVGEVEVAGQAVLPTGIRDLEAAWNEGGLVFGRYTANLTIQDGEGNVMNSEQISFYGFPLMYTGGFIFLAFIIFVLVKFLKRRLHINISVGKKDDTMM